MACDWPLAEARVRIRHYALEFNCVKVSNMHIITHSSLACWLLILAHVCPTLLARNTMIRQCKRLSYPPLARLLVACAKECCLVSVGAVCYCSWLVVLLLCQAAFVLRFFATRCRSVSQQGYNLSNTCHSQWVCCQTAPYVACQWFLSPDGAMALFVRWFVLRQAPDTCCVSVSMHCYAWDLVFTTMLSSTLSTCLTPAAVMWSFLLLPVWLCYCGYCHCGMDSLSCYDTSYTRVAPVQTRVAELAF